MIYIICYLPFCLVYWNIQKITKKESSLQVWFVVLIHILVWIELFSCLFFLYLCMCRIPYFVIYVSNKIKMNKWFRIIILRFFRKGVSWKFWLDPRFPRNSNSKWILKWLPLDRSYFKFYFYKGESVLIISCHTHLGTRKFVILFQVIFVLPCILFLLKCPVIQCY